MSARARARSLAARAAFAAWLALGAVGCASFRITAPRDFAELEHHPGYDYRAVAAYGAALAVRAVNNDGHAPLEFWTEAVDRTLRRGGSYHPAGSVEVRTASGLTGRRLEYLFGDARRGSPYWITLFVTRDRVYLVEAGGTAEAFARAREGVVRAIETFALR